MKLYHYTRNSRISSIQSNGLIADSNYQHLDSELRKNAIYAWLCPKHDLMGYLYDNEYVLLEIEVDVEQCFVVNMDYISSAYVNMKVYGDERKKLIDEMISLYERTAVSPLDYKLGHFRAPEVIIKGSVSPNNIKVIEKTNFVNDNLEEYKRKISKKYEIDSVEQLHLDRILNSKKTLIAVHDDSSGIVATFKDEIIQSFFTLMIPKPLQQEYIKYFFK